MRFYIFLLLLATTLSCQKNQKNNDTVDATDTLQIEKPVAEDNDPTSLESNCYAYRSEKDTIILLMEENENQITGTLAYRLFEKDRNTGAITGNWKGDTLFAVYNFMSEGMQSEREVAFLKSGNALVEGYGPMEAEGDRMTFTADGKLDFPGTFKLSAIPCEE